MDHEKLPQPILISCWGDGRIQPAVLNSSLQRENKDVKTSILKQFNIQGNTRDLFPLIVSTNWVLYYDHSYLPRCFLIKAEKSWRLGVHILWSCDETSSLSTKFQLWESRILFSTTSTPHFPSPLKRLSVETFFVHVYQNGPRFAPCLIRRHLINQRVIWTSEFLDIYKNKPWKKPVQS